MNLNAQPAYKNHSIIFSGRQTPESTYLVPQLPPWLREIPVPKYILW